MPFEKGDWNKIGVPVIKVPARPTASPRERLIFRLLVLGWLLAAFAAMISVKSLDMAKDIANAEIAKTHELMGNLSTCQREVLRSYPPCKNGKRAKLSQCHDYISTVCSLGVINSLHSQYEAKAQRWQVIAKAARYVAWFFSAGTTLLFYGLRLVLTGRLRPLWPLGKGH
ncbi:MAG TPA: hypothetical protein VF811_05975 [Parasulfuritortus sp.]